MKINILLTALLVIGSVSYAAEKDSVQAGSIEFFYPEKLDLLISNFIKKNKENPVYDGYRVQLMASTNRQSVLKFKSEFYEEFPDKRPVLVYQQPNFKLRQGCFRTKLEAYRELLIIHEKFPDAFIIRDEIPLKDD